MPLKEYAQTGAVIIASTDDATFPAVIIDDALPHGGYKIQEFNHHGMRVGPVYRIDDVCDCDSHGGRLHACPTAPAFLREA